MTMKPGLSIARVALGIVLATPLLAQEMPPAVVVVASAEMRQLAPSVDVPGTVVSRYDARLASELEAKLEWIAEVGTEVAKGDEVARLESITFELREMEAQSRVKREQARVEFLLSERSRRWRCADRAWSRPPRWG